MTSFEASRRAIITKISSTTRGQVGQPIRTCAPDDLRAIPYLTRRSRSRRDRGPAEVVRRDGRNPAKRESPASELPTVAPDDPLTNELERFDMTTFRILQVTRRRLGAFSIASRSSVRADAGDRAPRAAVTSARGGIAIGVSGGGLNGGRAPRGTRRGSRMRTHRRDRRRH